MISVGMEVPISSQSKMFLVDSILSLRGNADALNSSCSLQPLAGKLYSQFSTKVAQLSDP